MKTGTFFEAIKDVWSKLVEAFKSINWSEIGSKIEGFIKERPILSVSILAFIVLVIVIAIISSANKKKKKKDLIDAFYSEMLTKEESNNLFSNVVEPIEEKKKENFDEYQSFLEDLEKKTNENDDNSETQSNISSLDKEDYDDEVYEGILEKFLEKKKKEIWDAVIVNKQQEAIIERDKRIESLLMELLDIKNNGNNSNPAREMLGESPINGEAENALKPDVIVPKIEINIPGLVVQGKEKVEEIVNEKEAIKPKEPEPIIEEPEVYSKPVNLNPINCEKIEVVQVGAGKKYSLDNMNTNRLGIVFTDEEIRNTIKD